MSLSGKATPLSWPSGWQRTAPGDRKRAKFYRTVEGGRFGDGRTWNKKADTTVADSVQRLYAELARMGVPNWSVILSTDNPLNKNGLPVGDREPNDPGAAVFWRDSDGQECVLAIDVYTRLADNIAALAATLEYMRGIERHGGATVMRRTFVGLKALPAVTLPSMTASTAAEIVAAYADNIDADMVLSAPAPAKDAVRAARAGSHPDAAGGGRESWDAVQAATRVLSSYHGVSL